MNFTGVVQARIIIQLRKTIDIQFKVNILNKQRYKIIIHLLCISQENLQASMNMFDETRQDGKLKLVP